MKKVYVFISAVFIFFTFNALSFSHPAGLYTAPFYLSITAEAENARIFYTLDGRLPTPETARLFTFPLRIEDRTPRPNVLSAIPGERIGCFLVYTNDVFTPPEGPVFKGTVIRARAFDRWGEPLSDVVTKSFFVSLDIFERYAGIPIISLVTNADYFFDDEIGIYVRGDGDIPNWEQRGREWERPLHLEFFETDGTRAVAMNMGVRIHGGGSRRLAQKSLRLYARSEYDPQQSTLRHDVFQGTAVDAFGEPVVAFNRLILRNFGNEGYSTMIRDSGLQYLARNMEVNVQAQRPAVVFLNGEFWGLYDIKERHDDRFLSDHYHSHRDNFAILSMLSSPVRAEVDAGSEADLRDFIELEMFLRDNSFVCDEMFAVARQYVNIESFIDHFIINIFAGNIDWPNQNIRVWRYNGTPNPDVPRLDGRWNWMLHDLDSTAGLSFGFNYNDDTLIRLLLFPENRSLELNRDNRLRPTATLMLRRFMENEGFRNQFINRFLYVLDNDLSAENFMRMVDAFTLRIIHVVPEQIARYGRVNSMAEWHNALQVFHTFGLRRPAYMRRFLLQHEWNYNLLRRNSDADTFFIL